MRSKVILSLKVSIACQNPRYWTVTQQPLLDQALEGLFDQLFARFDVVEDLLAQAEEAAVDPDVAVPHRFNRSHDAIRLGLRLAWKLCAGRTATKVATAPLGMKLVDDLVHRQVGQPVRSSWRGSLVLSRQLLHAQQPLADVGVQAGVDEGDPPVLDVAPQRLDAFDRLRTARSRSTCTRCS